MGVTNEIAGKTGRSVAEHLGAWLKGVGQLARELWTGEWVKKSSHSVTTGVSEKVFANGLRVVEKPGARPVATVPKSWLDGSDGLFKELRQGTWVTMERRHIANGHDIKVFSNGVKMVSKPGREPVVRLPQRLLTGGPGKI